MEKAFSILALLLASTAIAHARPVWHGGGYSIPTPTKCLYDNPTFEGLDGCDGAQPGALSWPTMMSDVRQSGQATYFNNLGSVSSHPMPFNVPELDYPSGINATNIPGGALIPVSSYSFPAQCSLDNTNQVINCNMSTVDVTIQGLNYTGWSISLTGSPSGANTNFHLLDSYWQDSSFTYQQSLLTGSGIVRTGNICTNIDVERSEFYRSYATYPSPDWSYYIYQNGSGTCKPTTTVLYSHFDHVAEHAIRTQSSGAATVRWNVFWGMGACANPADPTVNCAHGNFFVQFASQPSVDAQIIEFNVAATDHLSLSGTSNIALFMNANAGTSVNYTLLRVNHNMMITNANDQYGLPYFATISYMTETLQQNTGTATATEVDIEGNAFDCAGAFGAIRNAYGNLTPFGTVKDDGNWNLQNGSTQTFASSTCFGSNSHIGHVAP